MMESWSDCEEYGILSENSETDPSYSSSSRDSNESSKFDLASSRARIIWRCPM